MAWNDGLDEDSPVYRMAVSDEKVIRSLAGPGSGKSFAIKRRITRLIEKGVTPDKILAITFTRTSASDLRKEISNIKLPNIERVNARTVHSHAMSIIMKSDVKEYTKRNPRMIIDHEIEPALRDIDYPPETDIREKKKLLETYLSAWANNQSEDPGLPRNPVEEEFQSRLIKWLTYHQAVMVGEVIPIAINYLRNNPACGEIGKYEAVLVDEYQDLNKAEQEFIHLIRGDASILIVGDDDQSIYSFKNAHPEGIKNIDSLYGDFQDVSFNTIRRCPIQVTKMASSLISKNTNRSLGVLVPFDKNQNGEIQIIQWNDNDKELEGIHKIIKSEIDSERVKPGEILVLAPRRLIGYRLRDKLSLDGIPVKSYFRESVIKNENVRKAYSLLYLIAFPDDKVSLRYLLGAGSSDYRMKQYKVLFDYAIGNNKSIREVLGLLVEEKISLKGLPTIVKEYVKMLGVLNQFKEKLKSDSLNAFEMFINGEQDEIDFYELINIYQSYIATNPLPDVFDDDTFIQWLRGAASNISDSIALIDSPEEIDHVRIMSLHASKGLSAKFVILLSMIDEFMPFLPRLDIPEGEINKIVEEQRRLFYVAITRVKSSERDYPGRLIISSYIWIHGIEASRMGLSANPKKYLRVSSTRFINDFGRTAPRTILGKELS